MSVTTHKRVGAAIALLGSTVAAFGALGHLNVQIAVGIAVTAILVGTGVARGKFSVQTQRRDIEPATRFRRNTSWRRADG